MNKKFGKIGALATAGVLALALAGCAGSDDPDDGEIGQPEPAPNNSSMQITGGQTWLSFDNSFVNSLEELDIEIEKFGDSSMNDDDALELTVSGGMLNHSGSDQEGESGFTGSIEHMGSGMSFSSDDDGNSSTVDVVDIRVDMSTGEVYGTVSEDPRSPSPMDDQETNDMGDGVMPNEGDDDTPIDGGDVVSPDDPVTSTNNEVMLFTFDGTTAMADTSTDMELMFNEVILTISDDFVNILNDRFDTQDVEMNTVVGTMTVAVDYEDAAK